MKSHSDLPTWRKPGQIASLIQFHQVRRREFMKLARLAVRFDAKLAPIVEDWDRMKPARRNAANLDALCEAHGVDPTHFISVVGEVQLRLCNDASVLIAALSMPAVLKSCVKNAMKKDGFKDRELLMKCTGFLPQPKGSQMGALNYVAIRAETNTNIGEPLPTFEETIELLGDEE